ncbi:hypothetical protein LINPERPRIM_LOCUS39051 [Linum perenne]
MTSGYLNVPPRQTSLGFSP